MGTRFQGLMVEDSGSQVARVESLMAVQRDHVLHGYSAFSLSSKM